MGVVHSGEWIGEASLDHSNPTRLSGTFLWLGQMNRRLVGYGWHADVPKPALIFFLFTPSLSWKHGCPCEGRRRKGKARELEATAQFEKNIVLGQLAIEALIPGMRNIVKRVVAGLDFSHVHIAIPHTDAEGLVHVIVDAESD